MADADRRSSTWATPSTASRTSWARGPTAGGDLARNHWFLGLPAWARAGTPTTTASRGAPATGWSRASGTATLDDIRALRALGLAAQRPRPVAGGDRAGGSRRAAVNPHAPPAADAAHAPDDFIAAAGALRPTIRATPIPGWRCTRIAACPRPQPRRRCCWTRARSRGGSCCRCCARWRAPAGPGRPVPHARAARAHVVARCCTGSSTWGCATSSARRRTSSSCATSTWARRRGRFIAANSGDERRDEPAAPADAWTTSRSDLFLRHDLNLYNFIIRLNAALAAPGRTLAPPARIDFDAHRRAPDPVRAASRAGRSTSWTRSRRSSSTRRCITCCSDSGTSRAPTSRCSSTRRSAIYAAQMLGDATHLALVNNRHPMGAAVVAARGVPAGAARARGPRSCTRCWCSTSARARRRPQRRAAGCGLRSLWAGPERQVTALLDSGCTSSGCRSALVFASPPAGSC